MDPVPNLWIGNIIFRHPLGHVLYCFGQQASSGFIRAQHDMCHCLSSATIWAPLVWEGLSGVADDLNPRSAKARILIGYPYPIHVILGVEREV